MKNPQWKAMNNPSQISATHHNPQTQLQPPKNPATHHNQQTSQKTNAAVKKNPDLRIGGWVDDDGGRVVEE